MSDALNGSVAPFCHSQDRPGGVPVAVLDQPAGQTGESAFVQHQPLGSRKDWYNESHADMQNLPAREASGRLLQGQGILQGVRIGLQQALPPREQGSHPCASAEGARGEPGAHRRGAAPMARQEDSAITRLQTASDVRADRGTVRRNGGCPGRCLRDLQAASTGQDQSALRGSRSFLLPVACQDVRRVRPRPSLQSLQPRARRLPRRSSATGQCVGVPRSSGSATSSNWRRCMTTSTCWSNATPSTASTGSSSRSRGGLRESFARSSTRSVRGYRPCGPTPTSSPRSAARPWRLSRSTWRTSATSERPYLPTAEAGGFSGGIQ